MISPRALFISPHLDDAVFSCGGLIAQLTRTGTACTVVTVLTGNVERPTGFALRCQTDKGIDPSTDYMALRRDEDIAACRLLGADWLHLPLLEAPHRGYADAAALFAAQCDDDTLEQTLADSLQPILNQHPDATIFSPYCLGEHIDHRIVRAAVERFVMPVLWQDEPYAQKQHLSLPKSLPVPLTDAEYALKCRAMACYASQLPFQFGGVDGIARLMPAAERYRDAENRLAAMLEPTRLTA